MPWRREVTIPVGGGERRPAGRADRQGRPLRARGLGLALLVTVAVASAEPPKPVTFVGNGMGPVTFLRFSPNGKELVRVCQFGVVEIFDAERYDSFRSFEIGMRMVSFSPDGMRIATAEGIDGARVWDATVPGRSAPIPESPAGRVREIRLLETPLRVLEAPSSKGRSSLETRADGKRVLRAEFSPDGTRVLTAQASGHVKVWNARTWEVESEFDGTDARLRSAVFAPDGKTIVVGGEDGVLHEWSLEQKKEVHAMRAPGAATEVVFAPDGSMIATVHLSGQGGSVAFWGRDRTLVETKDGWTSVAISKDGKALAIGGRQVDFLDPSSRKRIRTVELPAITMRESNPGFGTFPDADTKIPVSVTALAFSPDGATLAAGCVEGSVRLVKTTP